MPSRAVLRKKQRRDAKRKKTMKEGGTSAYRKAPPHVDEPKVDHLSASATRFPDQGSGAQVKVSRKRTAGEASHLVTPCVSSSSSSSHPTGVPDAMPASNPIKCPRLEAAVPAAPMPDGLTRKERHRWEASHKLERQMTRLDQTASATKEMLQEAEAQRAPTEGKAATNGVAVASEVKLRHDPKFRKGTFWRDRKERRARTLFLGGVPASFSEQQVKDFISTVVDSDPGAVDYLNAIGKDAELVEEVDMLPPKHQSKVKHMYVTMASVPLAGCAAAMLDRYKMEGKELRCNFAADKTQREEAIRRRDGVRHP